MEVSNGTSHVCNWTSPLCPHRVYNFTDITEKSKVEGRQSRFFGLILGMDPISMLRPTETIAKPFDNGPHYDHIQYHNGTREINRYRAVVNVKNIVEVFAFLYVLKITWEEHDRQPIDDYDFRVFTDKIKNRYDKKMEVMRLAANMNDVIPEEDEKEEGVERTPLPPYVPSMEHHLRRYLMQHWQHFRKLGRMIMKNGWFFHDAWKAYEKFKREEEFSEKITGIISLTQMKQSRKNDT